MPVTMILWFLKLYSDHCFWLMKIFKEKIRLLMDSLFQWLVKRQLEYSKLFLIIAKHYKHPGAHQLPNLLSIPMLWFVAQSCLTLCDPMDCSPPAPLPMGILQARIRKWVAMPSFRGSSQPRDQTQVSCIAGGLFAIHC